MTRKKNLIFLLIVLCLFLTGCNDLIDYDEDQFRPEEESCWPCQMYLQSFNALSAALNASLETMCSNCRILLTMGLVFFVLYKVFPWVVSLSEPKFKEEFVALLKVCFKGMIIAIILTHPNFFYDVFGKMILQPIGGIFLKVSELVVVMPSSMGVSVSQYSQSNSGYLSQLLDFAGTTGVTNWRDAFSDSNVSGVLDKFEGLLTKNRIASDDRMFGAIPMQVQSVVWQIYSALWSGMGLVYQLLQSGYFSAFIASLFLAWSLLNLLVYLPLSFVDAFFRMGMGIMLMPLFMTIWVFPIKMFSGMGRKLLQLILSGFFDILFNCIYVAFLVSVLRVYVEEKVPYIFNTDYQTAESSLRRSGLQMSTEFLVMTVLVWTIFKLFSRVGEITGKFFESAGQGNSVVKLLDNLKDLAIKTAIATARAVATSGGDLSGFKDVAQKAGSMAKEAMDDMTKDQDKDKW